LTLRLGWNDQSAEEPYRWEEGLADTYRLPSDWSSGFDDDSWWEIEQMKEGPTKGKTHEQVFSPGWHRHLERCRQLQDATASGQPASSGYTLTVVLNFGDQQLVGFVSGAKEWYPVRGTFQVVK